MTPEQQLLNLLGLAQRAGQLVTGEPMVLAAIKAGNIRFLWVANDMGASSKKKLTDKASFYHVPVSTAFNVAELSQATGRQRSALGVSNAGFAKKMQTLLDKMK
ncbi:YlxQ-related RNA-binding protein [Furfurilactobacillus rossiae]|uniref:Ribosomal protein eL8/eL30/eS12/Gadd45 domain-containing protein n=1 Tax=Furfurilactobacillus rossiae DSM 15814 TaxID=1114972 RepID=A0A0R1RJ98_9LACO|nr:YlxQ-related RNA-binding protein [Furfurilactobacillus rossiae]KRL57120.1 hypothetical protein FD35_GL000127 [Furfurilactobacillus rossiae DSM 15814]MCF6165504.1 YlxQ-related RNA-binding protein [Furfurilactobacillus rossiae]QFR65989.1 YlxQ-related RNA-binding protein [Furfurilactobacillus rossiae]QLE61409.1 ribosomal protein L7Ae protein [Furfurilactobacillus rossiae]QLE64207.1 ribosomal protein L7Ae family protein [Furfurilactobacillus rossiae]